MIFKSKTHHKPSADAYIHLLALVLIVASIGILHPQVCPAASSGNVLILPFQINAQEDTANLSAQITAVLSQQLEQSGALVKHLDSADLTRLVVLAAKDTAALRHAAQVLGVSQILWGSLTMIGESFSLDAVLLKADTQSPGEHLFVQGRQIENLLGATQQLARDISLKLFPEELVARIEVQGNQRIEKDAILRQINTRVGGPYQPGQLAKDIEAIYRLGYFDDIRIEAGAAPAGKTIIFHVTEKPTIRQVHIKGNDSIDEKEIKENISIVTGGILNLFQLRKDIDQIKALYETKNYYNVQVDYKINRLANNQADIELNINEGDKIYVTQISFQGNTSFDGKTLRKIIKTKEKGFWHFISGSGELKHEVLDQDVALLTNFYHNHGYIYARVGEPQIDIVDQQFHITLKIEEGSQYSVRHVNITGELIKPQDELLGMLGITKEAIVNREVIRQDVLALTDVYANQGYAYAKISPTTREVPGEKAVDITYTIEKNKQVYFENIFITGNTRTRDKVIRRELKVKEQGLFSNEDLKRSVRNLYRLEDFEDIKVDTTKGSADDKMDLSINVTEKSTASFTLGLGYSDAENVFINGSISNHNFLGKGQTLELSGQFGSRTTEYVFSFIEPWLFDIPLYFKITANDEQKEYTYYNRHTRGGGLMLGYRIWDFTNIYWGYNYDDSDITLEEDHIDDIPESIKELEGKNITSSVDISLVYDSRDRTFNTTEGMKHSIYFEYAGLGGDIGFNKLIGSSQVYFPLFKKVVGFLNGKAGYVYQNEAGKFLPDYEKFYLGGVTSLRGFGWHDVAVTETITVDDGSGGTTLKEIDVGGNTMVQFNAEIIIPIFPDQGINCFLFYDTGNVYNGEIDLNDMRQSAGVGIRWLSPLAPIQFVYGQILDRRDGESSGRFEFAMGGTF